MKRNPPRIGIPTNLTLVEQGKFIGMERLSVPRDYIHGIVRAGGVPILLPIIDSLEILKEQVNSVDGILLAGGQDVHPHFYEEEPSHFLEDVCLDRDHFEMEIVKEAYAQKKPILGICRGLQLINIAFGGTLYQDISTEYPDNHYQHSQNARRDAASHHVEILSGTKLHEVMGSEKIVTNSFHHQSIKKLAPGFKATAFAKDRMIEGIERLDPSLVLGVQWHPEMMLNSAPEMQRIFNLLVEEALAFQRK